MDTSIIISFMGAAGIGGIIGAYFQSFFSKRREVFLKLNSINEERYKNLLYHMNIILNPKNVRFINHVNPSSGKQFNQQDHFDFVEAEYLQSILYAPDNVVNALKEFLKQPSDKNFIKTVMKMRVSLWNKKTKLEPSEIIIEDKDKK